MDEYIPPAGIRYWDTMEVCTCVCHSMPGVMHIVACCDGPLSELICSECNKKVPKHKKKIAAERKINDKNRNNL